jgi:hypothetical protein
MPAQQLARDTVFVVTCLGGWGCPGYVDSADSAQHVQLTLVPVHAGHMTQQHRSNTSRRRGLPVHAGGSDKACAFSGGHQEQALCP